MSGEGYIDFIDNGGCKTCVTNDDYWFSIVGERTQVASLFWR